MERSVMTLQAARVVRVRPNRDDELRDAHQRAFTKMHEASARADRRRVVSEAVQELIDACEAYTEAS